MRKLWNFRGGLKLDGHKKLSMQQGILNVPLPKQLVLPMQQHIGEAAEPIVKIGDSVLKGQLIAECDAYVSSPVHASSSGIVTAIEQRSVAHPSGLQSNCVVIDTDGKDEWCELNSHSDDYKHLNAADLRSLIHEAGIVGLGGAGFPSHIKLNTSKPNSNHASPIDLLILNAAECEPYITCDAMLLQTHPRDAIEGLLVMRHATQAKRCIIGIEDNKQDAIKALQDAMSLQDKTIIDIMVIPTRYPAGSEKQLIYSLTGIEISSHELPINHGIICQNVGTAVAVNNAIHKGQPLISRTITLTGEAVKKPCNVNALIGTPMSVLLEFANVENMQRLIMGGPMMGFEVNNLDAPVIKTSNCLLTEVKQTASKTTVLPCIRCGECAKACPINLLPQQMYWHARAKELDKIQDYNLFDCIECGCCSYVCPSNIPLVQYYRFAKTEIWANEKDKIKSDHARERHEFHQLRAEQKKLESEERKRKKREMLKRAQDTDSEQDAKKAAIQAALDRVKNKKITPAKNVDNLTAEQQKKIDEVEQRRKQKKGDST